MTDQKFKVVIVGGGSSGWMTAAYLSKAFGRAVDIRLVESSNIGSVGVGEATFSDIHLFFEFLELQEEDWMRQCNACYKIAIRFVDWNEERRPFYHPFEQFQLVDGRRTAQWWLKLRQDQPFDSTCFVSPHICDAQRSPRFMDGRVYDPKVEGCLQPGERGEKPLLLDDPHVQYPYAYHFDASLFAKVLAEYAKARGVSQIVDDVQSVELREDGYIRAVRTQEHGDIEGDLFVDCTGFRGLLINQALGEPFISFLESLPCDRAIAMQVPSDGATEGIDPFTSATALSSGWVWNIPLFHRIGTGYVYSSAFRTAEEAEREFRGHLGKRAENCNAAHIKIRVGRNRDSWVNNCVAIGLSSGFVEPLESTGLFFVQYAIEQLVTHFPGNRFSQEAVKDFNRVIADCIDGVREFLTLHYVAGTRRDTPFWKMTKSDLVVPDALAERLRLWKTALPSSRSINPRYHGFAVHNYCSMLLGLGWRPQHHAAVLDYMGDDRALDAFARVQEEAQFLTRSLPSQYEYLAARYGWLDSHRPLAVER
jgi:flavin-dependent dehydrogenase